MISLRPPCVCMYEVVMYLHTSGSTPCRIGSTPSDGGWKFIDLNLASHPLIVAIAIASLPTPETERPP